MKEENVNYLTPTDFDKLITSIPKLEVYHKTWQTGKGGVIKARPSLPAQQFQLLFKLSYYCALRITEALRLIKNDFDLETRLVRIRSKIKNVPEYTTIPSIIIDELRSYLESLEDNKLLFNTNRQTSWKYAKDAGNLVGLKLFKRLKQIEIEGASTRLFRDSWKRNMRINGADDELVNLKLRVVSDLNYSGYDLEYLKTWEEKIQKIRFLSEDKIKSYVEWYKEKFEIYKKLSDTVKKIIEEVLDTKKIEIHYIESRPKEILEFEKKIKRGIKFNPKDMQDLAGIRVICFVKADVDQVCSIIEKTFYVIASLSMDKSKILGENKMGYLSIHYVAKLPKERVQLEEMKKFENLLFEIQVRTILQHAWAEIEHDRLYKYSNDLPKDISRRFYLISSLLESADNEFQRLHDIESEYSQELNNKT